MDAKILVSGVVGLGLLGVAGFLILGGEREGSSLKPMGGQGSQRLGIDDGASAYTLAEEDDGEVVEVDVEPRDIQPARGDRRGGRERGFGGMERMEERLMQFDADGDGILDQSERDAMALAMRERMIERFDADGDGMVSIEEQFAARRGFMLDSRRGERMQAEFDLDGDGELNEAETAAMNQSLDERDAERMAEIVKQYDTDGDGEMSVEETLAMQDQQTSDRRSRMDDFAIQFDQDGDGNLDTDERADAMNSMIEQRELDSFLRRYDTNKDGEVGTSDTERFTDAYGEQEPYGDVNRDGIFNMDDVVMFRDMTERANAASD